MATEAQTSAAPPATDLLCEYCGWTVDMVCPECVPGCGCPTRCTGWRHRDWGVVEDLAEEHGQYGCPECGAGSGGDPYGECVCPG